MEKYPYFQGARNLTAKDPAAVGLRGDSCGCAGEQTMLPLDLHGSRTKDPVLQTCPEISLCRHTFN